MQKTNTMKLASGMLVLAMLLSGLALLPGSTATAAGVTNQISFNVIDAEGSPVSGVQATLREVHTLKQYTNATDSSGLAAFSPWPGYYKLTLTKSGYFDKTHSSVIRFDRLTSVSLDRITLTPQPAKNFTLTVNVLENGTANGVIGARLKVLDPAHGSQEIFNSTSVNGSFSVPIYNGTFKMVWSASGYSTNVSSVVVSTNKTVTVYLDKSIVLRGYVYLNGTPVSQGLKAYMVSTASIDLNKKIVRPKILVKNFFEFDAYAGEFYLLVDAMNAKANMTKITLSSLTVMIVNLTSQSVQTVTNDIDFYSGDWNHFNLTQTAVMDYDTTIPGLDYSYIPNVRMQIDLAVGNGDGNLTLSEVNSFRSIIFSYGPQNVTSDWLMKVNGSAFVAQSEAFTSVTYTGLVAFTNSTNQYTSVLKTRYDSVSSLATSGSTYTGDLYTIYDTATIDQTYTVSLPDGYELTDNTTSTSYVSVYGYTDLTVTPTLYSQATPARVTMAFQKSVAPTAVAALVSSGNVYAVTDANSTVLYYIAAIDREVTFTAAGSHDPNGNPLRYIWDFGDGNSADVTTVTTKQNYTDAAYSLTVNLRVVDVASLEDDASFEVRIDSVDPTSVIAVKNKQILAGKVTANQTETLIFNGAGSVDYTNSTSDAVKGIINSWKWDFGDGNTTTVLRGENQNVSHAFVKAGTYTVKLNVTDVVGHYKVSQLTVEVKDTTAPIVSFAIKNDAFATVSTATENKTLYFDASTTTDNVDTLQNLTFFWEFGDGKNATGMNVTHNFTAIKTFNVKLTVTDKSGNSANLTKQLVITSSPRPDLRVSALTFEPTIFVEGELGTIRLNVTNVGNANATNIVATFYKLTITGEKVPLGTSSVLNGTVGGQLRPNQFGYITFQWRADTKGNYTIFAEVATDREITKTDNTYTASLTVNEAGWKAAAIYGGIFAVIVVVIVLIYMRKRLPKIGGRSKPESKPEKEKGGKERK